MPTRVVVGLFCAGVLFSQAVAQSSSSLLLREALAVSATNVPAALAICDRVLGQSPTNSRALAVRAGFFDRLHRYDAALDDLSAALKLDPTTPDLWQGSGEIQFKLGHFKESVAAFDRVLEFAPSRAPYHWQRGISLYYAGRFSDARKQFELHRTVNPNDVENAAWHFLCTAREHGVAAARKKMLPVEKDSRVPMREIDALYRGLGTPEQVLSAAARSAKDPKQPGAMFYAHLYLGLYFDVMGESAKAREHISKAAHEFGAEHYMGDVARVHLRTLETNH